MNPKHPHKKWLRLFVSAPMAGKTDEEIKTYINELYFKVKNLPQYKDCTVILLNSFVDEDAPVCSNVPVWYLAKSVEVFQIESIVKDLVYICLQDLSLAHFKLKAKHNTS
jgi:hypothetical protein